VTRSAKLVCRMTALNAVAIHRVAKSTYGVQRGEIAKEVCDFFGFTRVTEGMTAFVGTVISRMLGGG